MLRFGGCPPTGSSQTGGSPILPAPQRRCSPKNTPSPPILNNRSQAFTEHLLCARPWRRQDGNLQPLLLPAALLSEQQPLSSLPNLGPDYFSSAYYAPGLLWLFPSQPLYTFLLCAHTPSGLSPSQVVPVFLSPLAQPTGSSRRGQGPLGLQSQHLHTQGPVWGEGGAGGRLPVYENRKDPQGGASDSPPGSPFSLDLSCSQRGPHISL